MGKFSSISWTGATWNSWQGCRTKSEGCRFCYMFRDKRRYGQDPKHIHRSSKATFDAPLKWQREVERGTRSGQDRLVFTCSWSDWFIEEADAWRDDAWAIIRRCPDLIFQILTKRADRIADHLPAFWDKIRERCWLGVSAEDQRNYDLRRPYVDAPLAPVMWWSLEPLLGPINLGIEGYTHKPAWIVVGGESGRDGGIRPMHPLWARSIRDECIRAGIPLHFKQWGEFAPMDSIYDNDMIPHDRISRHTPVNSGIPMDEPASMFRVGVKAAGRILDGRTWDQFPEVPHV